MQPLLNFSTRKVGGIRFLKLGRLSFTFCLARSAKPIKQAAPARTAADPVRYLPPIIVDTEALARTLQRARLQALLTHLETTGD